MPEYVPRTVIELQTRPYYGSDNQLQPRKRIFQQMFWTFDPCVCAFPYCKPFVQVDETGYTVGYLDAKNGSVTSQPDGGRTRVCRRCKGCNGCKPSDSEVDECKKQFIDEVYTLEHTLHVWENEFPVLPDLFTWEVPPMTFEFVPEKGCVGTRKVICNHPESITKWTLGRN
ncbi:hypothetical protein PVK06_009271 [Gossypium arboreum]|uniref:Uncharacterized protein n=1 Tax=Gossypium arboreum TaxID=29729 RepID=A0ABR0QMC2_GOSAR|nr:hypothetical protein PVK06_009271 [Gossypium arboreum]